MFFGVPPKVLPRSSVEGSFPGVVEGLSGRAGSEALCLEKYPAA